MAKRAITLFAVDKKSKNRVSMVARTRGLKKAKKIEAAVFHFGAIAASPSQKAASLVPTLRRMEDSAILSLSPPPPSEEDATFDDDGSPA